jgi:tetratricopeptide (TPR) repeat protein
MQSVTQMFDLALRYHQGGNLQQADLLYRQILRADPWHAEALHLLGVIAHQIGKSDLAVDYIKKALRIRPDTPQAHNNLGIALRGQGKLDEAIASYQQALRLNPDYAEAHNNLGNTLSDQGKVEEAVASYREALRLKPDYTDALGQLAVLLRGKLPDADRAVLEQRLAESDLNDFDRAKLLYGLAGVRDARGEYAQAAVLLRQANALSLSVRRLKGQVYDRDVNACFVNNIMATFTAAFFERVRGFGLDTERPVFIFGLPRSGTTLTEQILAAHSQVFGAGELDLTDREFRALGAQSKAQSAFTALSDLQPETVRRMAQGHLDHLAAMNDSAARVVDKMPDNVYYLGLLAVLFPRAKFIHCRRDLRDVAVSCWMTNFRDYYWANDPNDIAARFREYQRLIEHWRTVLPVAILEVQYEETVADLPGAARRLVEWCGLHWDPACLSFHEGFRPVRTPSKIQVREPVYTRSVGRWRHYEQEMSELLAPFKSL